MKKRSSTLAAACAFAALLCFNAPVLLAGGEEDLRGKWTVDFEESAKLIDDEKIAAGVKQSGVGGLEIVMEFKAEGKAEMSITGLGQKQQQTGTWKILKEGDKTLTIELVQTQNEQKDELIVKFVSKDRVNISKEGDPVKLVFNRVKE